MFELLVTIAAQPDDDTLRLAYADALEESDDYAQIQCYACGGTGWHSDPPDENEYLCSRCGQRSGAYGHWDGYKFACKLCRMCGGNKELMRTEVTAAFVRGQVELARLHGRPRRTINQPLMPVTCNAPQLRKLCRQGEVVNAWVYDDEHLGVGLWRGATFDGTQLLRTGLPQWEGLREHHRLLRMLPSLGVSCIPYKDIELEYWRGLPERIVRRNNPTLHDVRAVLSEHPTIQYLAVPDQPPYSEEERCACDTFRMLLS